MRASVQFREIRRQYTIYAHEDGAIIHAIPRISVPFRRRDEDASRMLLKTVQSAKRQQVSAACRNCRSAKSKCDGQRPCGRCNHRDLTCEFATNENETYSQAMKRRVDELARENEDFREFLDRFAKVEESQAVEIWHRLRRGARPAALLTRLRCGSPAGSADSVYERDLVEKFIITLCQSTASLQTIVECSTSVLTQRERINFPRSERYQESKDRIVRLETFHGLLGSPDTVRSSSFDPSSRTLPDGPLYWVPGAMWTELSNDDTIVSHLVTLYLQYVNSYWRFLESDLFLHAIRSRTWSTSYCSPFLVNAILACAALVSEVEEAFADPGDLLTRGAHFHDEALRLWELEGEHPSLVNIQALLVLSLESSHRGQDKLGLELAKVAAAMNKVVPVTDLVAGASLQQRSHNRARECAASAVAFLNISYTMGLLLAPEEMSVKADELRDLTSVLPDVTVYWVGYPFKSESLHFRSNRLTLERNHLMCFAFEMVSLLFAEVDPAQRNELLVASEDLAARMPIWYQGLPSDLQAVKDMPSALFEFHGQYNAFSMILWNQIHVCLFETPESSDDGSDSEFGDIRVRIDDTKLHYAYRAASLLRDFRESYGYKAAPAASWIWQQASIATPILLQDLLRNPQSHATLHEHRDGLFDSAVRSTDSATEECFHCLLSSGLQMLLPRAIWRMMYHTGVQALVDLPEVVKRTLKVVADLAWPQDDLRELDSFYPNLALVRRQTTTIRDSLMEDILRRWNILEKPGEAQIADGVDPVREDEDMDDAAQESASDEET